MKTFESYLTEKKNSDVIKDFADGKSSGSTKHLFIEPRKGGRVLINYRTVMVYKPNNEDIYYMNADKYSVTTSKIQSYIRRELSDKNLKQMSHEELQEVMDQKESGDEV